MCDDIPVAGPGAANCGRASQDDAVTGVTERTHAVDLRPDEIAPHPEEAGADTARNHPIASVARNDVPCRRHIAAKSELIIGRHIRVYRERNADKTIGDRTLTRRVCADKIALDVYDSRGANADSDVAIARDQVAFARTRAPDVYIGLRIKVRLDSDAAAIGYRVLAGSIDANVVALDRQAEALAARHTDCRNDGNFDPAPACPEITLRPPGMPIRPPRLSITTMPVSEFGSAAVPAAFVPM